MTDEITPPEAGSSDFFREVDIQLLVHELKSPLSLIEAATRTLLKQPSRLGPLTERQKQALQRILRGAVRGRSLVHHLLEIGGAESSQFTLASFDPAEAVTEALLESLEGHDGELAGQLREEHDSERKLALLAHRGIQLRIDQNARSLRIYQDPTKFELIISNIIQNALRFRKDVMEVELHEEGSDVFVVVKDDGPGISPEHHALVFERYRQLPTSDGLERKGHGLGLAGALILARRLGGDISLDSVPGSGATFCLRIPSNGAQTQAN
jgi:two-component system, OmpR family, sensor kinase